ncbi:MAG: twin-arginine translocation signal domain-containing protein, partial [Pseudomonadota bacterium]
MDEKPMGGNMSKTLNRRNFLRGTAVAGAGALATPAL